MEVLCLLVEAAVLPPWNCCYFRHVGVIVFAVHCLHAASLVPPTDLRLMLSLPCRFALSLCFAVFLSAQALYLFGMLGGSLFCALLGHHTVLDFGKRLCWKNRWRLCDVLS